MFSTDFKVRLILVANNEILLLKQTSANGGKYTLPGGTVEKMEFANKALKRECKEELGIKINKNDLQIVHVLHKKKTKGDRVTMYFQINQWENEVECLELDKFEKFVWLPIDSLPEEVSPTVQHVLEQLKLGNSYSNIFLDEKHTFKKWKKKQKKRKRKLKHELKCLAQEQVTDLTIDVSTAAKQSDHSSNEDVLMKMS